MAVDNVICARLTDLGFVCNKIKHNMKNSDVRKKKISKRSEIIMGIKV